MANKINLAAPAETAPAATEPPDRNVVLPTSTVFDGKRPRRVKVWLESKTPLAVNPLEVTAMSAGEARKKFFDRNGISDSIHPLHIEPVEHGGS